MGLPYGKGLGAPHKIGKNDPRLMGGYIKTMVSPEWSCWFDGKDALVKAKAEGPRYKLVGLEYLAESLKDTPGRVVPCQGDMADNAALFLASDEAKFVNGVVLTCDGGWNACKQAYHKSGAAAASKRLPPLLFLCLPSVEKKDAGL